MLRRFAALRVEVSEFLHALLTHGSLELFIVREPFVYFRQTLVTDHEEVGAALPSKDLLEHSPVRAGHALLITGLAHTHDLGPLPFFSWAHMEEQQFHIAHLREVRARAQAHLVAERKYGSVHPVVQLPSRHRRS